MTSRDRRDGEVVRASASQSVDLGFISQVESYQKTLKKMVYTASLFGAQHERNNVENKPCLLVYCVFEQACLFVVIAVSLSKTLNGIPPSSLCGRQVAMSLESR